MFLNEVINVKILLRKAYLSRLFFLFMAAIVGEKEKGEGKQGTPAPPPPPPPGQSQEQQPGHSFLATLPEIRNMEHSLLALLNSFHAGELSAFGQSKLETMNLIREKQERLARHHFDIGSSKVVYSFVSKLGGTRHSNKQ